jgi:hypothetical protein
MAFRDHDSRSFSAVNGCCFAKRFSSTERETHSSFDFNYTISMLQCSNGVTYARPRPYCCMTTNKACQTSSTFLAEGLDTKTSCRYKRLGNPKTTFRQMEKRCFWVTCVGNDLHAGTEITNDRSRGVHRRLPRLLFLGAG